MMAASYVDAGSLVARLPKVRGRMLPRASLAELTWFRVGGPAEALFLPADEADLAAFLATAPRDIPVTVVGVGSNLLVRDGGVRGVVVRLGRGFADIRVEPDARVRAGGGALDVAVARKAADSGITGLEFLRGIPGTIGGGLRMNAGAYGSEFKDIVVEARALNREGRRCTLTCAELDFHYRRCGAPDDLIFVEAVLAGQPGHAEEIAARMAAITTAREGSQPVRSRTGGSTFKNPATGKRAWELIEAAGCRGLTVGDAQVSEMHCNFLINRGAATAADLESLGEEVRRRVHVATGVALEWEIKRIGEAA